MISDISSHPIHHELFDKFLYPEAKRGDRKSKVLLIFSFFEYHAFINAFIIYHCRKTQNMYVHRSFEDLTPRTL